MKLPTLDVVLKTHKTIKLQAEAKDWKDVIYQVVDLMVNAKLATKEYADAIIAATEEFGPYYLVAENVVMPHAKPGDYNLANGFALLTLKKPVMFGDQLAQVVICLGATTADFHVSVALPQIAAMFDEPETTNALINAKTPEEVLDYISKINFSKYLNEN